MTDKLRGAEREAFEHALASKPDARFWNTTDAMFWAWQARAALAQQDAQAVPQEPCAVVKWQTGGPVIHITGEVQVGDLLYRAAPTPPAQRVMLTDEEIRDLWSWSMTAEAERTANTQQHAFAQGVIEAYERKNGIAQPCWCQACRPITINDMRMVLCPKCGNKRCPHANDHRNPCTGSNEPGQPGSAYQAK